MGNKRGLWICLMVGGLVGIMDGLCAAQTTTRVSMDHQGGDPNAGSQSPIISADGRYITFSSFASDLVVGDTNVVDDIFVNDRQMGSTTRVSVATDGTQGNGDSSNLAVLSADGRYIAFESESSNLVSGDTNGASDIFVHDRHTGTTSRVSVATGGIQGNDFSYFPGK